MSRLHAIELHLLMLAGIAFLCVSGWQVWRVSNQMNAALLKINGPHGTIAMADEDVGALKSLIIHTDLVARHEQQQLGTIDEYARNLDADFSRLASHSDTTLDGLDRVSSALTGTANAATQTLHGASLTLSTMNDSIVATKPLLEASTATVKHADAVISNPAIPKIETHIQGMTDSGDKMLSDAQWKTHQLLHPPKKKLGFWGGFWVGMQYVHKLLPPIF